MGCFSDFWAFSCLTRSKTAQNTQFYILLSNIISLTEHLKWVPPTPFRLGFPKKIQNTLRPPLLQVADIPS
jgi:hypothetical protein